MNPSANSPAIESALAIINQKNGMIRMAAAVRAGIHRNTLQKMIESEILVRESRGLYRLADRPLLGNPDLVTVSAKVPKGVICLISALSIHELTTQIPHEVYIAISRNASPPRIDYPPVRSFRFSGKAFTAGVEQMDFDGFDVPVYSREKTIADCFKYRNQIGMDTVIEAIKFYKSQPKRNVTALMEHASVCRVGTKIRPYLESIL
jgi:predicted transcriptional regulator of viral defense system